MKYGKLIDGQLTLAPRKIVYQGMRIYNPPAEVLLALGYKPVQYTDPPEIPAGYHLEASWTETSEQIVQGWSLVPDEEVPDEEVPEE